jgi:predicted CXXCH cytochrome family protein
MHKISILLKHIFIFTILVFASIGYSASIVNSKHDLSYLLTTDPAMSDVYNQYNEVCVYCHTPHSANTDIVAPLWNREKPSGPYNVYTSSTMDTVPPNPPSDISLACLSCHDGTIAVDAVRNAPGSGANLSGPWYGNTEASQHNKMSQVLLSGNCSFCHGGQGPYQPGAGDHRVAYLIEFPPGTSLSNDHPISMTYPTGAQDPAFNTPPDSQKGWGDVKLFNGKVECASCHDVHDPTITPFLRKSNSGSALCYTCHIK